ncbi:hypothetical protein C1646_669198 [Rhizophagus diaphanus]|nr:hypothetical protein C1646_669198 [Rhizophagus diaphanus] [Rhizophagus sp. MUCL 43196]
MENPKSSPPEKLYNYSDNPAIKNPDISNIPDNLNISNNPDNNPDISNNPDNSNNLNNPNNTENPNRKISFGSIRIIFQKFFKDVDTSNMSAQDIQGKLFGLLINEFNNSTKPQEMIEVNHVKHLPGEAIPITKQSTDNFEQKSNEPPKDKKDNNDKESKESKESKEPKETKESKESKESKDLKELKEKLKKREKELKEKEKEEENLKKYIRDLEKSYKEIENAWANKEKSYKENEIAWSNIVNQLSNEKLRLESKLEHTINAWNERYDQLDEQLKNKRKDYIELHKKNEELRNEASQYQSALGDARNYRLGDNDANNPTQLTMEIGIIQDKINEFCKIKGGVDINEQNLARLLSEQFNCKYSEGDKVLPKAALQRIIVETIITRTNEYLTKGFQPEINDNKILNKYLELDIMISTQNYLSKINTLINSRTGTDEVSFAAPKKIQQLVYAVLGDRGFGLSSDKREHEFVQGLNDEIIKYMSQFRTIKKADKRKENEDMLADIIRNVIKMFVFRIKVLEPPAELIWIEKDTKVDATLMEVGNLEDDNYDDWVVNLCSFPLICVEPSSETNRKVLVPAKILAARTEQKSFSAKSIRNFFHGKPQQPGADEAGKPTKKNSIDTSN